MKKIIMMLAAAAVVASCTKTEIYEPNNADGVLIQVKPMHQGVKGELSRAPFIGNIGGTNHLAARVITYAPSTNVMHADGTMTFKATNEAAIYELPVTDGNHKFVTTGTDNYTLAGFYPATGWTDAGTSLSADVAKIGFDGTQDVMVAAPVTTTPDAVAAKTYPTLSFAHQLTKIEIKVRAKDAAAAALWKEFEAVELTGVLGAAGNLPNAFEYTLDGGAVAFSGAEATFPFYVIKDATDYTPNVFTAQTVAIEAVADADVADIKPVAYSMIAPFVSKGDNDLTFAISAKYNASSEPRTVNVSIPAVTTSATGETTGYAYRITFTFSEVGLITAEAEVIDWVDGGDLEEIIM